LSGLRNRSNFKLLLSVRIIGSKLEWLSPAHHLATLEHPEAFNTMLFRFLAMQSKD